MPAPPRAKLIHNLGDLIAAHVPEIAQMETNDCGQVIAQTGKQLISRAADNFYYLLKCAPGLTDTPTRLKRI